MKYFLAYISTAPVVLLISVTFLAGLIIEINRFFPSILTLIILNVVFYLSYFGTW